MVVQRIEEADGRGGYTKFYPAVEGLGAKVGDEVVIGTGSRGAPNEIKTGVGEGFAANVWGYGGEDVGVDAIVVAQLYQSGLERGAALCEVAKARDVFGEFFKNNFCAAGSEGGQFLGGSKRHAARRRDDEDTVTSLAAGEEYACVGAGLLELGVGDVVKRVPLGHEGAGDFADRLLREPFDVVNREGFYGTGFIV